MGFEPSTTELQPKFRIVSVFVVAFFAVILFRLFQLQIIKGSYYWFFSTQNSIKENVLPAPRGLITDRRNNVLVENRAAFDIVAIPQYVVKYDNMSHTISKITSLPNEKISEIWEKRKNQPAYWPLVFKADAPFDEMSIVRAKSNPWPTTEDVNWDLRGIESKLRFARFYENPNLASHVLGYVKEIDTEKLKYFKEKYPGLYKMGDQLGVQGLEERWDIYLRGKDGYEQSIVDASGREVYFEGIGEELQKLDPLPGYNLKLTIDKALQEIAETEFAGKKGAAVAIDVETGAVRLMFSAPTYDLNKLSSAEGSDYYKELSADPSKPLINRAIHGAYPPASTYKIVTGIAGLSEGEITSESRLNCAGSLVFGGRPYKCWAKSGHGSIDFHYALVHSCDVFFYRLGLSLGVDKIAKYANMLGLGNKTGINLEGERSGLIPTAEWKLKRFGVPWQAGENISISIGQGYDSVTPIQNALVIAQVVNGGYKLKPFLVEAIYDNNGRQPYTMMGGKLEKLAIPDNVLASVREALAGVVHEGGTGARQASLKVKIGGKTGTAQVVSLEKNCTKLECRDHAWFVGFGPIENPKLAVAVIVEHGGFGASSAAPIAGKIIEKYAELEGLINEQKQ